MGTIFVFFLFNLFSSNFSRCLDFTFVIFPYFLSSNKYNTFYSLKSELYNQIYRAEPLGYLQLNILVGM